MKDQETLIYDLIFSEECDYIIDIGDYIKNIYKYDDFINSIRQVLKKSKVKVVSNSIDVDSKSVIWKLKVKK